MKGVKVSHAHVFYSGRVQGVGFRYQALQVAQGFEVAGYVRNLTDGRVELEAEGSAAEVEAFLDAVTERMEGLIKDTERDVEKAEPRFKGFSIR